MIKVNAQKLLFSWEDIKQVGLLAFYISNSQMKNEKQTYV